MVKGIWGLIIWLMENNIKTFSLKGEEINTVSAFWRERLWEMKG